MLIMSEYLIFLSSGSARTENLGLFSIPDFSLWYVVQTKEIPVQSKVEIAKEIPYLSTERLILREQKNASKKEEVVQCP